MVQPQIERFDDPRVPMLPTHSHAVRADGPPKNFAAEINIALDALEHILETAGASLATVVRTNCYLSGIDDMLEFNEVYFKRFGELKPARSTIQGRLAHGLRFAIDAVAIRTV